MANTNNAITVFQFENANEKSATLILNMSAGGGSFDPESSFKITGYKVVNGVENTYNSDNGTLLSTEVKTKRPMLVLTTTQEVNIFFSQFRKTYKDVEGNIHRCGGEVFDAWRKVSRNGKTNEQYAKDLLDVTKDANGEQRELVATYDTITWINPRDGKDAQPTEKAILSIDFKE